MFKLFININFLWKMHYNSMIKGLREEIKQKTNKIKEDTGTPLYFLILENIETL